MIAISKKHKEEMLLHVIACLPEEACGLIGGKNEQAMVVIPIENRYHSPVRFRMDEMKLLKALTYFDQKDWEMIGIFHSHPNGPSHPSITDIEELDYIDVVHIICFPNRGTNTTLEAYWDLVGYQIIGKAYQEVPIEIA